MHIATKMHFLKLSCGCVAVVLINQRERGKRCPGVLAREWLHLLSGRKDDSWVDHGLFHTDHTMFEEPVR